MPATIFWSRSTPLIWVRRPASIPASASTVNVSAIGSGPSAATPGTSAGSATRYTARRFFVPASVRSKPAPSVKRSRKASGLLPGRGGASGRLSRQCRHQVQELAVPLGAGDDPAPQRGQVGLVGLEDRDGRAVRAVDDMPAGPLSQEAGERLDLGKFRHAIDSASCPGLFAPRSPRWGPDPARRLADRYHSDNGCLVTM